MKITNRTRGGTIAEDAGKAETFGARLKGLIGRRSLERGSGLLISPCSSIHTFWMRFPIDAVFFDREKKVVAVLRGLQPSRLSGWYPRARGVIEVPAGTLAEAATEPGDQLDFS